MQVIDQLATFRREVKFLPSQIALVRSNQLSKAKELLSKQGGEWAAMLSDSILAMEESPARVIGIED